MIVLSQKIYDEIISHVKSEFPLEACGYLAGIRKDGVTNIKKSYPMINIDKSNEHYTMEPAQQFEVFNDSIKNGTVLAVCYHSHPETPSRPSVEDIALAYDSNISYMIVSLMDLQNPVVKSFKIKNGVVTNEDIKIIED